MSEDDNVKKLPVRFKKPLGEDGRTLKVVTTYDDRARCKHTSFFKDGRMQQVTYLLRDGETEVECGNCSVKLDPMWVLQKLAYAETDWDRKREVAAEEMKRLNDRVRTTCQHCGKMTKISRS